MYDKEIVDELLDTAEKELEDVMSVIETAIKIAESDDSHMSDKTKLAILTSILIKANSDIKDNVIAVLGRIA